MLNCGHAQTSKSHGDDRLCTFAFPQQQRKHNQRNAKAYEAAACLRGEQKQSDGRGKREMSQSPFAGTMPMQRLTQRERKHQDEERREKSAVTKQRRNPFVCA